jgi:hypothetical protein
MIKETLYATRSYFIERGKSSFGAADWIYCMYFFGILVRTFEFTGMKEYQIRAMFPKAKVLRDK